MCYVRKDHSSFKLQKPKNIENTENIKTQLELKSNKYLVINQWNRPYKFIGACIEVTWESLRESIL